MSPDPTSLHSPSPEHRRVATGQFERANQVVAAGNYDYGIRLLLSCCKLDPGNLIYRQALRRTQKLKFKNNLRGSWLAWLTAAPSKARVRRALAARDYVAVLEYGENVLTRNPWHVRTQMAMSEAADALGLLDMAVWALEQARQNAPHDPHLNRALAQLYEKRGNFKEAILLWELVQKADPQDTEARSKAKDLAAHETIARGHYAEAAAGRLSGDDADGEKGAGSSLSANKGRHRTDPPGGERPLADEDSTNPTERRHAGEIARLRARVEADPSNANNYLQLAGVLRRNGQLDQARSLLSTGLAATGNNFELASELADLEIEPFRQNLTITEQRLGENPDDELRRIRVRLLKEINARELELFRIRAARFPTDLSHRFELGVRLLRAAQVEEAIRELQAARSDPRLHWKCLLFLGHCFKARNNWKLARRNFEEALQNLPSNEAEVRKELYWQLASGCAEAGELQTAVDFATELANLDFSYRDIGEHLDDWQGRLQEGS